MKVLKRAGFMDGLYLDYGPGFDSNDTALICARLKIPIIFGRIRYPEGHGKIEKINQTIKHDLLRGLSADFTIDPACESLEYRIEHYLRHLYNVQVHERLKDLSPDDAWERDEHPLRPVTDLRKVEEHFIVTESRKVSRDNIVMLDNIPFEMPLGHLGRNIQVFRHFLENKATVIHEGRHVTLSQVDLHANARDRRIKAESAKEKLSTGRIKTAAQRAFEKDHSGVVSTDGDFYERT